MNKGYEEEEIEEANEETTKQEHPQICDATDQFWLWKLNVQQCRFLRNQNQTAINQINSMTSALMLLQNENKKNETLIDELKKQHKDNEYDRDQIKKDLEIEEDCERGMEIMLKEEEHLNEKLYNVRQRIAQTDNENNKFHIMRVVNEAKNDLANLHMKQVNLKHEIDENDAICEKSWKMGHFLRGQRGLSKSPLSYTNC